MTNKQDITVLKGAPSRRDGGETEGHGISTNIPSLMGRRKRPSPLQHNHFWYANQLLNINSIISYKFFIPKYKLRMGLSTFKAYGLAHTMCLFHTKKNFAANAIPEVGRFGKYNPNHFIIKWLGFLHLCDSPPQNTILWPKSREIFSGVAWSVNRRF
ncbi:MAG: hypothetical protein LBL94_09415 [Prevotellaceae bacterium]|jgi:hypothetical protein|nr:hypothetical protein [Prevotellaceae bacterium]